MRLCACKSYPEDSLQTLSGYWNTLGNWNLPFGLGSLVKALHLPLHVHVRLRHGTVPRSAAQGQTSHLAFEGGGSWVKLSLVVMHILLSAAAPRGCSSQPALWALLLLGPSYCRARGFGESTPAHHTGWLQDPQCWLWELASASAGAHIARFPAEMPAGDWQLTLWD